MPLEVPLRISKRMKSKLGAFQIKYNYKKVISAEIAISHNFMIHNSKETILMSCTMSVSITHCTDQDSPIEIQIKHLRIHWSVSGFLKHGHICTEDRVIYMNAGNGSINSVKI